MAVCEFTLVPCPNLCKENDKIIYVIRNYLDIHINNECLNRYHKCEYCGEKDTYANITQNHYSICQKKKIPCTNTECTETIERGKMKLHLDDCDHTIIPCKYKNIGCDVELKRKDMPAHEEDDNVHLHQALGTVHKLQDNLQSASDTIAAQNCEVATLQDDMKLANNTITALQGKVATLQGDKKSASNTIAALQGKVITLQGDIKSANNSISALRVEVATLQDDMKSANSTITVLQGKVATLQGDTNSTISAQQGELAIKGDKKSSNSTIAALQGKAAALQESAQDTLQSVTSTGKLIFKLTEYQKKKDNNEETMSPSFYTSPQGYHMCLQVYANGIGDAKQPHVSAFVKILKGEHDKSLKWPFIGTYIFELLNQLEDKNHRTKTLIITSTHKLSVGSHWGYHTFIPHSELSHNPSNNTQYLEDDTLYFRLTVTPSDHRPWLDQY